MEYNDIYDQERCLTGRVHRRGTRWKAGEYGLVVCVWVYDGEGNMLLTRRAPGKSFAGTWENSGGAAKAGEDSLTGAIREAEEEVGVRLDPAQGRLVNITVRECFQDIKDDWLFLYDGPIDLRNATTDEVADMRWMSVEEIRKLYDAGELVHTLGYFFDDPELGGTAT